MSDMPRPRVLLLEDDAGVRRFMELALEDVAVELLVCSRLSEALQVLAGSSVALVLLDLYLPDGSGLDLLEWLQRREALAACRTVVFSGGIDTAVQKQLQALQVWRVLHKPVPLGQLQACVREVLAHQDSDELVAWALPAEHGTDPVAEFFGGNQGLYEAYRSACLAQFPKDLDAGDLAVRASDARVLRRVAHNLKSALSMLGWEHAAQLARSTEDHAEQGMIEPMRASWQRLRQQVRACIVERLPG
ncbi:MAG: response regulator [Comamonas sp.]|uniref:Hpt domain-containing response regulator n=1 Tax=Comamonas TaxID=283 RepID=UPI000C174237|nr:MULTISPECIES: response regulator [Comamonas]PIG09770.1 Hpt domain-containing protein [Comamonas sp. 26]WQD44702.1 response regulator [Comamonas testosteroni]